MATFTGEITIDRPPEVVFDLVADEEQEPRYNPEMLRAEKLTEGPIGVGTRFKAVHASRRQPVEMIVELTEYDRPTRLASATTMPWGEVHGALVFQPDGPATRMRWTWDVRPKGVAKFFSPFITVVGKRSERACWKGLKRYLETTAEDR